MNITKAFCLSIALLGASNMQAITNSDFVIQQDNTQINNYQTNRPEASKRLFVSQAVEQQIAHIKQLLTNARLAWMFENCFPNTLDCSVLNKLTLLKCEIPMKELKKKYTPYTESERMSYIREYLSTSETKYQFAKRTGICRRLLILWLDKYHINDKVMSTDHASFNKYSAESLNELEKELAALRAENRKLQRALQEESLRHEACEELINLAESTYHIKVRKNSDAK